MNIFAVRAFRDTAFFDVAWELYGLKPEIPNSPLPMDLGKYYIFTSNFIGQEPVDKSNAMVFYPQSFERLSDLLSSGGNRVVCSYDAKNEFFKDERKNAPLFCVLPTHVDCGEPYPTYASIAQHRPADLHFFKKFADADFYLVTQTFVDRVKATGVRGLSFVLRWDGERSYPLLPKT